MEYYQPLWDQDYTGDRNYYRETTERAPPALPLQGSVDVDVCVIGAGFTGCATAYFLKDSGLKTAVLERHHVGWGASGRCGGQILPGYCASITGLSKKYGEDITKTLWDMSVEGIDAIKTICRTHNIDCDLKPGALYLTESVEEEASLQHYAEFIDKNFNYKTEIKSDPEVAAMMGTDFYQSGLLAPEAAHFHPVKYLKGLADILTKAGISIYESTPAEAIRKEGDTYFVHTPNGLVRAKYLALCGDSYLEYLVPELRKKYVLIRNALIGTGPLDPALNVLPADVAALESATYLHFFRKAADGSLLFGGGDVVKPNSNILTSQSSIIESLCEEMVSIYPQLKNCDIRYRWGGYIAVTNSLMPNVGMLDEQVFYANGYSGHGINVAHITGKILAEAIAGKSNRYSNFSVIHNASFPGAGDWDHLLADAGMHIFAAKSWLERMKQGFKKGA
jgi:gamma-glutamylputrescine oxidase